MKGNIVHFEVNAKDAKRAKQFYSKVFGWKFKDSQIPDVEYYIIDGVNPGGAVNPMQTEPGIVVYFETDDIEKTLKDIRDAGGQADPKQPVPTQGWFATCVDTEGNRISLFQSDPSVTMDNMPQRQETRA
jgi:predicted enzyme related to lactoylglutathione lyase